MERLAFASFSKRRNFVQDKFIKYNSLTKLRKMVSKVKKNWFNKHPIWTGILIVCGIFFFVFLMGANYVNQEINTNSQNVQEKSANPIENAVLKTQVADYWSKTHEGEDINLQTFSKEQAEAVNQDEEARDSIKEKCGIYLPNKSTTMFIGEGYLLLIDTETKEILCDYLSQENSEELNFLDDYRGDCSDLSGKNKDLCLQAYAVKDLDKYKCKKIEDVYTKEYCETFVETFKMNIQTGYSPRIAPIIDYVNTKAQAYRSRYVCSELNNYKHLVNEENYMENQINKCINKVESL